MPDKDGNKNDCYSSGERGFMQWGQDLRARLFLPVLVQLDRKGFNADYLTILALLFGLVAGAALVISKVLGLLLLLLHVVLDGLDGPLARYQHKDSNRGSFTDTMSDQIVIAAVMAALLHLHAVSVLPAIVYVMSYTIVVGFAFVRNALKIPYSWLFRPRFIIYAWLPVEFWLKPGSLDLLLWICNGFLLLKTITGFIQIRRKI